ncbi:MAG: hypothetical protein OCC46_10505 [Pseudodesulfovibrio sp.]
MTLLKMLLLQCVFLFLLCGIGHAQPKKLILLETMRAPLVTSMAESFLTHLGSLGYQDGKDFNLVRMNAEGDLDKAVNLLKGELEKGRPDIVVTVSTFATKAAKSLLDGTDIPLVFLGVSDPVGAGIVAKTGKPTGKNITGVMFSVPRVIALNIMLNTLSNLPHKRPLHFGVVHSGYPAGVGAARRLKNAAQGNPQIQFVFREIQFRPGKENEDRMIQDAAQAARSLKGQVDFMWQDSDYLNVLPQYSEAFVKASPVPIGFTRYENTFENGALLRIAPSAEGSGIAAAKSVDAIWRGTAPGSIPVLPPEEMDVGLNLITAKELQLAIPLEIMELAKDNYIQ